MKMFSIKKKNLEYIILSNTLENLIVRITFGDTCQNYFLCTVCFKYI